ncbi:MAG TPA: TPM domain-containing protein [Accumulibacter sp.]|nr:TPM domain-containing protein [Accumulibacter sp.]HMW18692.1 TPM domain-containing protein [Accumulibacter sp.]HNC18792.1 TPM domain-containing protein [Accumulibacter sp.]HND81467.1 TPM domain-containing protein [Accumulibacter sp.]HNE13970.1 TPM domain-containing protein [Accumulibacter sp.]
MSSLSARVLLWLFGLLWLVGGHALYAADLQPIPRLTARVTDSTSTLSAEQRRTLETKLADFERQKGSQIAVLIVSTVAPESIEQYALRVAEAWKLGRRGVDDGALLLIAKQDRKLRIEVGYGLEGAINDATAKRVISEIISPRFKDGDFYGGIDVGIDTLMRLVGGEPLPPPAAVDLRPHVSTVDDNMALLLFAGFLLVFVFGRVLRAIFGRFLAAGIVGVAAGTAAAYLLSSLVVAAIAGVVAFMASLMFGTLSSAGWSTGGFSWGSGRGGGFGGSGGRGGGGGFSGGGGGFGGGGASGGW